MLCFLLHLNFETIFFLKNTYVRNLCVTQFENLEKLQSYLAKL